MHRKLIRIVIVAVIFIILGSVIIKNWQQIKDFEFNFKYHFLIISFILFILVFFMAALGWGLVLKRLGVTWRLTRVVKIWFLSQFTRWLPGNFWSIASMFYLSRGVPKATIALSGILGIVFHMVAGIVTVSIFFYWWPNDIMKNYSFLYLSPAILFLVGMYFYPALPSKLYDNKLSRYFLKKFGKERYLTDLPKYNFGRKDISKILLFYVIYWCISGIALYFFVISIIYIPLKELPACILIHAIAWIISFLAFVSPGGLGIKESIITVMFAYYIPLGMAAIISLVLRIWMIICELFCLLVVRITVKEKA